MRSTWGNRGKLVLAMAAVAATCVACSVSSPPLVTSASATPQAATGSPDGARTPRSSLATPSPSTSTATPVPTCAERTLASMTEAQRIGQLFMVGLAADELGAPERTAIASDHFGSVWFTVQTAEGAAVVGTVAASVQSQATEAATAGVGFFVAANQEGGLIQALGGPGFNSIPTALDQGTMGSSALEAAAMGWGRELRAAGVNLDFAPVADVVPSGTDALNAPIGQLRREFGHDAATVASHAVAFIAGMAQAGIATTVKHFPGLGRVVGNTDFAGGVSDPVTTRTDPSLEPFAEAIAAGVPFVMVSLVTYPRIDPAHLAAFSPAVIGGLLRGDLHYSGVVISDDFGAAVAVASVPPARRALDFLDAGGDMIISKTLGPAIAMAQAIAARAATDESFRARVDDAALGVLLAKEASGLLPCGG
jgi:beta-N-acetylhexosaminidase